MRFLGDATAQSTHSGTPASAGATPTNDGTHLTTGTSPPGFDPEPELCVFVFSLATLATTVSGVGTRHTSTRPFPSAAASEPTMIRDSFVSSAATAPSKTVGGDGRHFRSKACLASCARPRTTRAVAQSAFSRKGTSRGRLPLAARAAPGSGAEDDGIRSAITCTSPGPRARPTAPKACATSSFARASTATWRVVSAPARAGAQSKHHTAPPANTARSSTTSMVVAASFEGGTRAEANRGTPRDPPEVDAASFAVSAHGDAAASRPT